MQFVVPAPPRPIVPVEGETSVFPVRRIWCVGRNYADHAREMGHDPDREPPFFFAKPADAVVPLGGRLDFPRATGDLHHEVELAVALKGGGADLSPAAAADLIFGYAVAVDLTRRDLQAEAKRLARPWDLAKGFDQSCPIGALRRIDRRDADRPLNGAITLSVDGELRQVGDLSQMIWSVAECLSALSALVELTPGDLVLTGTPSGVGPINPGQTVTAHTALTPDLGFQYRLG